MLRQLPRSAGQPSLWLRALRIAAGATRFITLSDETVAAKNAAAKAANATSAAAIPRAAAAANPDRDPPSPATPDADAKVQSSVVRVKQRKSEAGSSWPLCSGLRPSSGQQGQVCRRPPRQEQL